MKDSCPFCRMDLFDQLLLLLVGVVILLINLGFLSHLWLAYWPLVLIAIALKQMLQSK